ncbi:hypothetical protein HY989_05520 [Candidatus Micrarchaeota archaeon]|nr:hypothetical protein [Candidatus Micrarchaeota archaeon]
MTKEPTKKTEDKFDWKEFLRPTSGKGKIVGIFFLVGLTLGLGLIILRDSPAIIINPITFFLILPLFAGLFFGPMNLLFSTVVLIVTLMAYWYLLACLITVARKKSNKIALIILALLVLISLSSLMLKPTGLYPAGRVQNAECLVSLAQMNPCYDERGAWNPQGCGTDGCIAANYGLLESCLKPTGPLEGTPWKKDETHFNCGTQPA